MTRRGQRVSEGWQPVGVWTWLGSGVGGGGKPLFPGMLFASQQGCCIRAIGWLLATTADKFSKQRGAAAISSSSCIMWWWWGDFL